MATRVVSVKRYVVRLSAEERGELEALISKGKSTAQRLLKARILLKADQSEAGECWSDSRIIEALDTGVSMVYRVPPGSKTEMPTTPSSPRFGGNSNLTNAMIIFLDVTLLHSSKIFDFAEPETRNCLARELGAGCLSRRRYPCAGEASAVAALSLAKP